MSANFELTRWRDQSFYDNHMLYVKNDRVLVRKKEARFFRFFRVNFGSSTRIEIVRDQMLKDAQLLIQRLSQVSISEVSQNILSLSQAYLNLSLFNERVIKSHNSKRKAQATCIQPTVFQEVTTLIIHLSKPIFRPPQPSSDRASTSSSTFERIDITGSLDELIDAFHFLEKNIRILCDFLSVDKPQGFAGDLCNQIEISCERMVSILGDMAYKLRFGRDEELLKLIPILQVIENTSFFEFVNGGYIQDVDKSESLKKKIEIIKQRLEELDQQKIELLDRSSKIYEDIKSGFECYRDSIHGIKHQEINLKSFNIYELIIYSDVFDSIRSSLQRLNSIVENLKQLSFGGERFFDRFFDNLRVIRSKYDEVSSDSLFNNPLDFSLVSELNQYKTHVGTFFDQINHGIDFCRELDEYEEAGSRVWQSFSLKQMRNKIFENNGFRLSLPPSYLRTMLVGKMDEYLKWCDKEDTACELIICDVSYFLEHLASSFEFEETDSHDPGTSKATLTSEKMIDAKIKKIHKKIEALISRKWAFIPSEHREEIARLRGPLFVVYHQLSRIQQIDKTLQTFKSTKELKQVLSEITTNIDKIKTEMHEKFPSILERKYVCLENRCKYLINISLCDRLKPFEPKNYQEALKLLTIYGKLGIAIQKLNSLDMGNLNFVNVLSSRFQAIGQILSSEIKSLTEINSKVSNLSQWFSAIESTIEQLNLEQIDQQLTLLEQCFGNIQDLNLYRHHPKLIGFDKFQKYADFYLVLIENKSLLEKFKFYWMGDQIIPSESRPPETIDELDALNKIFSERELSKKLAIQIELLNKMFSLQVHPFQTCPISFSYLINPVVVKGGTGRLWYFDQVSLDAHKAWSRAEFKNPVSGEIIKEVEPSPDVSELVDSYFQSRGILYLLRKQEAENDNPDLPSTSGI